VFGEHSAFSTQPSATPKSRDIAGIARHRTTSENPLPSASPRLCGEPQAVVVGFLITAMTAMTQILTPLLQPSSALFTPFSAETWSYKHAH
jgi:hypothetical protein